MKCPVILFSTFVWNISHSKKNLARYKKCTLVFMWSARYFCHILVKLEFSRQTFEKYPNTKFNENPSSGSRIVQFGEADGKTDEANSRLSQFYERVWKGDANVKNAKFANKKGKTSSLCLTKISVNSGSRTGKLIDGEHAVLSNT